MDLRLICGGKRQVYSEAGKFCAKKTACCYKGETLAPSASKICRLRHLVIFLKYGKTEG